MRKHTVLCMVVGAVLLAAPWIPVRVAASPGPGKFAVLISTGRTLADNTSYHSEYWYDTVLTYRMLIENGFAHDHIYVLYGNGTDFASTVAAYQNPYPNPITDYACNRANIQSIFNWLATGSAAEGIPALTNNDFLFVWWMGHGDGDATCNTSFDVSTTGEHVSDAELAAWTGAINYRRRTFVFMTCHSGGAMDNLRNNTTVVTPSCTCTEVSSSSNYDVWHGQWTYWVDGALRELLPTGGAVNSDTDNSNLVSMQETFNWGSAQTMSSTPQIDDLGGIAPCVFLRLEEPGEDVEVYSRDHVHDDATVPSNTEVWYHGPDLWVRHAQDGVTTHQNPEYGATNYVYANVHNIGCGAANGVSVAFSWVAPTGWSNPAMWTAIGTTNITSLASLASTTVNVPWKTVPVPGSYCLHTQLNVTGDAVNADGRAYMDDNKVQINVDVEDTWAGAGWGSFFFIENGGLEPVPIDLVFDAAAAARGTEILVEIPPDLQVEKISGAETLSSADDWLVLSILAGAEEAAHVQTVQLKPDEKRLAILRVRLPEGTPEGKQMSVLFEERLQGESVGGIQFIRRAGDPRRVMCDLLRKKIAFYYGFAKWFGIDEAVAVAEICEEVVASEGCADEGVFVDAMARIAELEQMMGEQLLEISAAYGNRYMSSVGRLLEAVEKGDPQIILEAQQEVFLYATIIMAEEVLR